MRKSYVYKIMCKINGEYYFGSSYEAKKDYYWGTGRIIKERIAKYGKENFVKDILGEFDDRVEAHKVENQYIEKFRHDEKCLNQMLNRHFGSFNEETCAKKSAANLGKIFSEEHKAKIGAANAVSQLGKHHTKETREKMSVARRGKHHTYESRIKMSASHLGKHLSDDTRAKISAAIRGKHWRKNPITGKREYYD